MPKFTREMLSGLTDIRAYLRELEARGAHGGYYTRGWAGAQLDRVIDEVRREVVGA